MDGKLVFRSFNEMIGARTSWICNVHEPLENEGLDFSRVFYKPLLTMILSFYHHERQDHGLDHALDHTLIAQAQPAWRTDNRSSSTRLFATLIVLLVRCCPRSR